MPKFTYIAQQYTSRPGGPPLLLFVAPAGEMTTWAGVPRKAFDYLNGFQRSLSGDRIAEVAAFYAEDVRNVSPTAVVVGFSPSVRIMAVTAVQVGAGLQAVEVNVEIPDYDAIPIDQLSREVLRLLEQRLQSEAVEAIQERTDEAAIEAQHVEDALDVVNADNGEEADAGEDITPSDRSHLEDFYAQLLGRVECRSPWPEDTTALREVLYSLLKPAIIVDGQHRVFGAARHDPTILLAVCAIPESNWAENVYQFVVINQKAKPIKPAFLSAIIANSLSQEELDAVYNRLDVSDVNIERSQIMERVNSDPTSPFRGMIDFEVPGSTGFLSFPGMWRLADDFRRIDALYPALLLDDWSQEPSVWLPFFFAFWTGIRDTFAAKDARLWSRLDDPSGNNLLKIVTLQEIQRMTLELWADTRTATLTTADETRQNAARFWSDFPAEFFTDVWRLKGLQTQVGRGILRDAMIQTRRKHGSRHWGHRKLGLFTG